MTTKIFPTDFSAATMVGGDVVLGDDGTNNKKFAAGITGAQIFAAELQDDVFTILALGTAANHEATDFDVAGAAAIAEAYAHAAQDTADAALTAAGAAQGTANNAQGDASTAQTQADSAYSLASTAASNATDAMDAANTALSNNVATQAQLDDLPVILSAQFTTPAAAMNWAQVVCVPMTIDHWILALNAAGAIEFDVKVNGTSIIGSGNAPKLTSGNADRQAVSGWAGVSLYAGDLLEFVVVSALGPVRAHVGLQCTFGV